MIASATPTATPPAPTAAPARFPRDARVFRCLGGRHWTLVTDEAHGLRELRAWMRIDPLIGATGPGDPAMPWERVGADAVRAIGVCLPNAPSVPGASPGPEAAGTTIVVRRPRDPAWPSRWGWEEVPVVPWAGEMAVEGGAMVAPAGEAAAGGPAWPVGDYVMEVRPGHVGPSAWVGLRIVGPAAVRSLGPTGPRGAMRRGRTPPTPGRRVPGRRATAPAPGPA